MVYKINIINRNFKFRCLNINVNNKKGKDLNIKTITSKQRY